MKTLFRLIHTTFFYLFLSITFIIGTTMVLLLTPFAKKRYVPFQFAARIWSRMLIMVSGARVTISGLDNIPNTGPLIFAANHQGAADILLMLAYMPRYFRFIIKRELFSIPFFGRYLGLAGYIPIDREIALASYKTLGEASGVLEAGECILIFPEGTRSRTGEVGPFKRGSLMMAMQTGATVVPIGISGSFKMMPKGSHLIRLVPVSVKIGKPILFNKAIGREAGRAEYNNKIAELRQAIISLVL